MVDILLKRYLWLIDILRRRGELTYEEISSAWERSAVNDNGSTLSKRTLYNHCQAVGRQFGIEISCRRGRNLNYYYIANPEALNDDGMNSWLIENFSVSTLLLENRDLADKILLDEVPSGRMYLDDILAAIRNENVVRYNPQNETCDALRTKRAKIKTKRFSVSKRSVPLTRFPEHPFFKKFRPSFAGILQPPGSVFEWPPNIVRRPFFFAFRFRSLRDCFSAFRSRDFDYRFVRGHALRFDEFAAEGQTRPDTRVRIRCIVTRIRARHAAIRIRVVAAAIDHTACCP